MLSSMFRMLNSDGRRRKPLLDAVGKDHRLVFIWDTLVHHGAVLVAVDVDLEALLRAPTHLADLSDYQS